MLFGSSWELIRIGPLSFGEISPPFEAHGNVQFELNDAAHILGSAQVKLIDPSLDFTFGYSGDIGSKIHNPIQVDVLVLDATYSNLFKETVSFNTLKKSKNNHWIDYVKGCLYILKKNLV